MATHGDFHSVLIARSLSGLGQGMLLIGVQSYILAVASPRKKTQGGAIIVFGFQGGMISGISIGSLLVSDLRPNGIFILGAAIALVMAVYTFILVPAVTRSEAGRARGDFLADIPRVARNFEFVKTMLCIGIPAKAALTGIMTFALPLLLAGVYAQEDIGQIIMVYAAAVIISSHRTSRLVDRVGNTEAILTWGAMISGIGFALIALAGWQPVQDQPHGSILTTGLILAGVAVVGIAHGFINAPVVTHVAESRLAERIGPDAVAASYRFLERLGHIAGPVIMGQLFLFTGQNLTSLGWVAGAVVVLGLLFLIRLPSAQPGAVEGELVR